VEVRGHFTDVDYYDIVGQHGIECVHDTRNVQVFTVFQDAPAAAGIDREGRYLCQRVYARIGAARTFQGDLLMEDLLENLFDCLLNGGDTPLALPAGVSRAVVLYRQADCAMWVHLIE